MTLSTHEDRRRMLCGIALSILGGVFLTDPLTHILRRGARESALKIAINGFAAPLHMLCLVASVIAIVQLLRHRADRIGLVGGALTVIGWSAGIRIMALGQVESMLQSGIGGVAPDTLGKMFEAAPVVWVSIVPVGILFPSGLTTLGLTLLAVGPLPRWIGAAMVLGAVLFPIGRIGQLTWAVVSCDLVLGLVFAVVAWHILTRPALWKASPVSELKLAA